MSHLCYAKKERDDNFVCRFCGCRKKTEINVYKHIWYYCNNCGNMFRYRKSKYFAEKFPINLRTFLSFFHPLLHNIFYPVKDVVNESSHIYDYLAHYTSVAGTKYEGQIEYYMKYFEKHKIDIRGKKILDISGGPGFLAKELTKYANKVVMTEYSQECVDWAQLALGLSSFRFDFNKDRIDKLTSEKFDVVLLRYVINFCLDIRSFLSSLKKILNNNAVIVVNGFVLPTLGTCIRWQFDDYTYLVLYNPETVEKLFAQEGFVTCVTEDYGSYYYMSGMHFLYKLLSLWYVLVNRGKIKKNELVQKHSGFVFKYLIGDGKR